MSIVARRRGSFVSGYLVGMRWVRRGRGPWGLVAVALLAIGLSLLAVDDPAARRTGWIELLNLLAPLLAVWVGAHAFADLRGGGRAAPLEGLPLRPFDYVLGQFSAVAVAVAAAAAVLVLPGLPVHGEPLHPAVAVARPRVEGKHYRLEGKDWAPAGRGRLVWSLPAGLAGAWSFETRLVAFYYAGYEGGPIRVRIRGQGLDRRLALEPEVPIHVSLGTGFSGDRLSFECESAGVAVTAQADSTMLVSDDRLAATAGWVELWWVLTTKCLLLAAAALTAALVVATPVALLAALTLWLLGWTARFLAEYAELAGHQSIFAAWAGRSGEPESVTPWLAWLGDVLRWIPDLRGAGVLDALGRGRLPVWSRVLRESTPHLLLAAGLLLAGAMLAVTLWRRRPGRIPGEGGIS